MIDPANAFRFDPDAGTAVRRPPCPGYGCWAGGHKVSYDPRSGLFVLFYRVRTPLERGRGGVCHVATSRDGVQFEDVWTATKDDLAASSIEVGHCLFMEGEWRLYVSYELARSNLWRIDVLRASAPDAFDTQRRRTALQPTDYGIAWIKDPFVVRRNDEYWLYATVPARQPPAEKGNATMAGPLDATVLATSDDGIYFPSIEYVFEAPADDSWHGRRARLNSVMPLDTGWLAMYDGGRTFFDNYEERAGIATSPDGRSFTRIATEAPWVASAHGSVRYVDALPIDDQVFFYYEYTVSDGSHELRVSTIDRP